MSLKNRQSMVDFALRHDLPILEDDVYGFLEYGDVSHPSLRSLDDEWVIYIGSFSKILAPALRVGWMVAPARCIRTLSALKEGLDLDTATFAQRLVRQYLESCSLISHIKHLKRQYRLRRDAMQRALLHHPELVAKWEVPTAGFYFWVESEAVEDAAMLLEEALKNDVAFVPGEAFCTPGSGLFKNAMRLNFTRCTPALIDKAITRIALTVREHAPVH